MADSAGVWLYAVAEGTPAAGLSQLTGVGNRPVRGVIAAGLAAIASDVGLDEFGESALRANLEDMIWLEKTATAHHRVIDAISHSQPVVPMRLATIYTGDAHIRAMLSQRDEELREVLRRINARKEWGVKAYAGGSPGADSGTDDRRPGPAEAGSGAAYLQRRRGELAAHNQARQEALAGVERVHGRLSELAVASRLHPPQDPVLAGTRATMILNAAYLVEESAGHQFSETVHQLAEQYPALQLQLTGPWPPYSFAGLSRAHSQPEATQ